MTGVTYASGRQAKECHLEYVWVAREYRRSGVARAMLNEILDTLKASGIRTVFLWVLEGNDAAVWLYKILNFQRTNQRQPLPDDPSRYEEQFRLDLSERYD